MASMIFMPYNRPERQDDETEPDTTYFGIYDAVFPLTERRA
jgi:hypothetical protein